MRRLLLTGLMLTLSAAAPAPTPRAVVEAMFRAVNAHDGAALAKLYADDAEIVSSDTCTRMRGPDAVRKGHEDLVRDVPDLHDEPLHWVVDGDTVAVLFEAHGKALGPEGKMLLADFLTVRNGKIVRDVTIFNAGAPCR